jgi:hypothetical protein
MQWQKKKQIPCEKDSQKGKGKRRSRSLWDDSQKCKGKGNRNGKTLDWRGY